MGLKRWEVKPETKQIASSASEAKNPPAMGKIVALHLPAPSLSSPVPSPLPRTPQQGEEREDSATGMKFVYVPKGCFKMGASASDKYHQQDEKLHEVCVDGFWMGQQEVTQGQWKKITNNNPARFNKGDDYPVESVSWDDTKTFIETLNKKTGKKYRLPTEAEWEYACRANGFGKYCGGDDIKAVAWYGENIFEGSTHPVRGKKANAFGLYDMNGNVWEWCSDWYGSDYYASSPKDNPQGPESGKNRALRGGSYFNDPLGCRAVRRNHGSPEDRGVGIGFRLALPFQGGGD
jgi:formylglycine-generating enzyme required for sulfatase activity